MKGTVGLEDFYRDTFSMKFKQWMYENYMNADQHKKTNTKCWVYSLKPFLSIATVNIVIPTNDLS